MKIIHLKKKTVVFMIFFFWNVHEFFIIFLRLEAVRVENRGGLKNIAQTLMARGILPNLYM